MPITSYKFGSIDPISGKETDDNNGQFVSSVCWKKNSDMLVAANSTGCIKVLQMVWSCKIILETNRIPLFDGLLLRLSLTNQIWPYQWVLLLTIHGWWNNWKLHGVKRQRAQTGSESTSREVGSQQFLWKIFQLWLLGILWHHPSIYSLRKQIIVLWWLGDAWHNCFSGLMPSKVSNNTLKVSFHLASEFGLAFAEQLAGWNWRL